jgi:hypothetical protein
MAGGEAGGKARGSKVLRKSFFYTRAIGTQERDCHQGSLLLRNVRLFLLDFRECVDVETVLSIAVMCVLDTVGFGDVVYKKLQQSLRLLWSHRSV